MSCRTERNPQGKVVGVFTESGEPSKLFDVVRKGLFNGDSETSLNIFGTSQTKEVKKMYEGVSDSRYVYDTQEPRFYYKTKNGTINESLEEIAIQGESGVLQMGFIDPRNNDFYPVGSINTEQSALSQSMFSLLQQGLISEERVHKDGELLIQGEGYLPQDRLLTARLAKDQLAEDGAVASIVNPDGTISLIQVSDVQTVKTKNGKHVVMEPKELAKALLNGEINPENKVLAVIQANPELLTGALSFTQDSASFDSDQLMTMLNNFLKGLGFSSTTMEAYRKTYNNRHGNDPDVTALLDLSQRVVALSENLSPEEMKEVFAEEVAHLAVEAYEEQATIEGALLEVALTDEYAQYAEMYRQKYSSQYSDSLALERAVRKEILGKIIAQGVLTDIHQTEESSNIWTRFVDFLKRTIKPSQRTLINRITKDVAEAVKNGNVSSKFTPPTVQSGVYYHLNPSTDSQTKKIQEAFTSLRALGNILQGTESSIPSLINASAVINAKQSLTELQMITAIQQVAKLTDNIVRQVDSKISSKTALSSYETIMQGYAKETLVPLLADISTMLEDETVFQNSDKTLVKELKNQIDSIRGTASVVVQKGITAIDNMLEERVNSVADMYEMGAEEKEQLRNSVFNMQKDISWLQRVAGLGSETPNTIIQMIMSDMARITTEAYRDFSENINPITNEVVEKGWERKFGDSIVQRDRDGNLTHYMNHAIRTADYEADMLTAQVNILKDMTGKSEKDIRKELEDKSPVDLLTSVEDIQEFDKRMMKEFHYDNSERFMDVDFYKERDAMYERAEVSQESQVRLEGLRQGLNSLYARFRDEQGRVDRSRMTEEDLLLEASEIASINASLSPVSGIGEFYSGVTRKKASEMTDEDFSRLPINMQTPEVRSFLETFKGSVTLLDGSLKTDDLGDDARMVIDNANMAILRAMQASSKGLTQRTFNQYVQEIKDLEQQAKNAPPADKDRLYEELFNKVMSNGGFRYTDVFYESQALGNGFAEQVERALSNVNDAVKKSALEDKFEEVKRLSKLRSEIIRSRRDVRDNTEINADNMSSDEKRKILELDGRISELRSSLKASLERFLPNGETFAIGNSLTITKPNSAFSREQKRSGMSEYDFALANMSQRSKDNVAEFRGYLTRVFRENPTRQFNQKFDAIIKQYADAGFVDLNTANQFYTLEELEEFNKKAVNDLSTQFAKDNLGSYYKKYELNSKEDIKEELREGNMKFSDLMNPISKSQLEQVFPDLAYLEFTPDYTWADTAGSNINPNYDASIAGFQPKFDKYKNTQFMDKFGIDEQTAKTVKDFTAIQATKNTEEWQYMQALYKMAEYTKRKHGDNQNVYMLAQVSKTAMEKIKSTASKKGIKASVKDTFADFFHDRIDEKDYGEYIDGQALRDMNIRLPVKYFRNKLESPDMVSKNYLSAYSLMAFEASKYETRMKAIPHTEMMIQKLESQNFIKSSIKRGRMLRTSKGQEANAAKMARDITDHLLYGVKQNLKMEYNMGGKVVDLTRVVRSVQKISSFFNLSLDPSIEVLSYLSGHQNRIAERITGGINSFDAGKRATSRVIKETAGYTMQAGKVKIDRESVKLLESLGIIDVKERLEESGSFRAMRILEDVPFMMANIANTPILLRIMYTNMYDTRYVEVNGKKKFLSYNRYKQAMKLAHPNLTASEIQSKWNVNDNVFMDFVDTSSSSIQPNDKFKDLFSTIQDPQEKSQAIEEEFSKILTRIGAQTKQAMQRADSVINDNDKNFLQRNALANTLMQHRGWLITNTTRMFKGHHFNIQNGAWEEGTYRTFQKIMGKVVKEVRSMEDLKNLMSNLSDLEKANGKRALFDLTSLLLVLTIALSLKASADDDDSWAEEYARYISYRLYSETKSNNPYGMYSNARDVMENPIVSKALVDDLEKTLTSTWDGKAGTTTARLAKFIPAKKGLTKMQDPQATLNKWLKYNKESLWELVGE